MSKLSKVCLWALSLTPFMFVPGVFSPFIMGENLFLRGMVLCASVFFIITLARSSSHREHMMQKTTSLFKNKLVLSISLFVLLYVISTVCAVDSHTAFWSTAQRGEGLLSLLFFTVFFFLSVLIFEKKDWLTFFKIQSIAALVVLIKQYIQFFGGINRPGSFVDNSSFLAGYLIFSILCCLIILSEVQNKYWKGISLVVFFFSVMGIFITQTRGTCIALILGFISVLVYMSMRGKRVLLLGLTARKYGIIFLSCIFMFSLLFLSTRKSDIWHAVPGVSRIALIHKEDSTIQTRLMMARVGVSSINPKAEGLKKFLIGWGPENFIIAYTKHFDPKQFEYEVTWFDRAHNKFIDVVVMVGILGLLAYLSIFFFYFKYIFRNKHSLFTTSALIFFGVTLFVHLFFLFDHITTYIALYSVLGFVVSSSLSKEGEIKKHVSKNQVFIFFIFCIVVTAFLSLCYMKGSIVPSTQMKRYDAIRKTHSTEFMNTWISTVFEPFTFAQKPIRAYFLVFVQDLDIEKDQSSRQLMHTALQEAEDYLKKNPFDYQFMLTTAVTYTEAGKRLQDTELLTRGEYLLRGALEYSPQKIDMKHTLAMNLFAQERYDESFQSFEEVFDESTVYYSFQKKENNDIYLFFLEYFSQKKDKNAFMKVVRRLEKNNDMPESVVKIINQKVLKLK